MSSLRSTERGKRIRITTPMDVATASFGSACAGREGRGFAQLDLAGAAETPSATSAFWSPGARPSREMIVRLAAVVDLRFASITRSCAAGGRR
jgi:hypothetical protein